MKKNMVDPIQNLLRSLNGGIRIQDLINSMLNRDPSRRPTLIWGVGAVGLTFLDGKSLKDRTDRTGMLGHVYHIFIGF